MLIKLTTFMCSYWGLQTQYNSIKESDCIFSISRTETQLTKTKTIVTLLSTENVVLVLNIKCPGASFSGWNTTMVLYMRFIPYILVHETMLFILLQGSTKFFTKPQSF